MSNINIAAEAAADKKHVRAWAKQHLTAKMVRQLLLLKSLGLAKTTKLFHDIVTPRDAIPHRDCTVRVRPEFQEGWAVLEASGDGGGIETFRTKGEALARAMQLVHERNAELHVTNEMFPTDEGRGEVHGF